MRNGASWSFSPGYSTPPHTTAILWHRLMYDRQHHRGRVHNTRQSIARHVLRPRAVVALMAASSAIAGTALHATTTPPTTRPPAGPTAGAASYGIAPTSQPRASLAGIQIRERGANAINAAI